MKLNNTGVVVIGAGVNGLACGTYLSQAGVDVTVLEACDSVGGRRGAVRALGAHLEPGPSGHLGLLASPIVDELRLREHGLGFLATSPAQIGLNWRGGSPFVLFDDEDRTLDAVTLTHRYEIHRYRSYLNAARPVVQLLLEMELAGPDTTSLRRRFGQRRSSALSTLLKWSRRTAADVQRSFFDDEALRCTALVTGVSAAGRSAHAAGSGLAAAGYALVHALGTNRPIGGAVALPRSIARSFEAHGGSIRTGTAVERIIADRTGVVGVRLCSGEEIRSSAVVVATNPRRAILQWLEPAPTGASSLVRRWEAAPMVAGRRSRIDAILAHVPTRRADVSLVLDRLGLGNAAGATTVMSPTLAGLGSSHRLMRLGAVARNPPMTVSIPSASDESLRTDDGDDVAAIDVFHTPYELAGGWAASHEPGRWLGVARDGFGPDFDSPVRWRAVTPGGVGADRLGQRETSPRFEGSLVSSIAARRSSLNTHETPVDGLFLCGSEVGGPLGLPGVSGRHAAAAILRSLGVDIPAAA